MRPQFERRPWRVPGLVQQVAPEPVETTPRGQGESAAHLLERAGPPSERLLDHVAPEFGDQVQHGQLGHRAQHALTARQQFRRDETLLHRQAVTRGELSGAGDVEFVVVSDLGPERQGGRAASDEREVVAVRPDGLEACVDRRRGTRQAVDPRQNPFELTAAGVGVESPRLAGRELGRDDAVAHRSCDLGVHAPSLGTRAVADKGRLPACG